MKLAHFSNKLATSSDITVVTSPFPKLRRAQFAETIGVGSLQRDITWGRVLFLPPELKNARLVFDPQPFRVHEFTPAKLRKQRSGR